MRTLILRCWAVDPELCPKCGKGRRCYQPTSGRSNAIARPWLTASNVCGETEPQRRRSSSQGHRVVVCQELGAECRQRATPF